MVHEGSTNGLPAGYRIGLALSLALLVHTLLLSGIPSPVREQEVDHRESVSFELIAPGRDQSARPAPESRSNSRPIAPIPRFNPTPSEPVIARPRPEPRKAAEPIVSEQPAPRPDKAQNSPESTASPNARPAAVAAEETREAEETVTRVTNSPVERDPYLVVLATHLARQLEQARVPAMRQLSRTVSMDVELQLLGNGALTRARILNSTGIEGIDAAAYRAALAASPYPEPPEDGREGNRFEVELVFTPKRL